MKGTLMPMLTPISVLALLLIAELVAETVDTSEFNVCVEVMTEEVEEVLVMTVEAETEDDDAVAPVEAKAEDDEAVAPVEVETEDDEAVALVKAAIEDDKAVAPAEAETEDDEATAPVKAKDASMILNRLLVISELVLPGLYITKKKTLFDVFVSLVTIG